MLPIKIFANVVFPLPVCPNNTNVCIGFSFSLITVVDLMVFPVSSFSVHAAPPSLDEYAAASLL